MLLTSSVNPFGVSSTLQMKVSLEIARVLTMLILPHIDKSLEDQMFNSFLRGLSLSKKFFSVASSSLYEKYTPRA